MADQNIERLRAGAEGGAAGMAAYDKAISDVKGQQQQALSAAAARSGALNAPEAFIQKQNALVAQPGNSALPLLGTQQAGLANQSAALQSAQGGYMSGVGQSKALLEKLGIKATEGLDAKALSAAASAMQQQIQLQKLLNPQQEVEVETPAERRAQTQFLWAQQAQESKQRNLYDETQQKQLARAWSTSEDPIEQAALETFNASDSYAEAVAALRDSKTPSGKEFKKLPPETQATLMDRLQRIYTPADYYEQETQSLGLTPGNSSKPWAVQ